MSVDEAAHGYARGHGGLGCVADERRVHALIVQRVQAKKDRDFKKADEVRQTLLRECGVELIDNKKVWKFVGNKREFKQHQLAAAEVAQKPIASGIGHEMLLKMGWGGQGSGLREGGIVEPVKALKNGKRKLQAIAADGETPVSAPKKQKKKRRKKEAAAEAEAKAATAMDEASDKGLETVAAAAMAMGSATATGSASASASAAPQGDSPLLSAIAALRASQPTLTAKQVYEQLRVRSEHSALTLSAVKREISRLAKASRVGS